MRKRSKKSKAILGAVALALLSFAGAKAGALGLHQQRLGNTSLRSSALHRCAALTHLPVTAFKVGLLKNRRLASNSIASNWTTSFSHQLSFAGAASTTLASAAGQPRRYTTSPRAPPIS